MCVTDELQSQDFEVGMRLAPLNCVVLDAGARYGLHPTWSELRDIASFHLFELDAEEATRLETKYSACPNITVHPFALYSRSGPLRIRFRRHNGLHSALAPDLGVAAALRYMEEAQCVTGEADVTATTVDEAFAGQEVHFLKLDTEGSELSILEGATRSLNDHVLGVRCEVSFLPMLEHGPLFGDIARFLNERGFDLLNFDYLGRGHAASRFTMPARYGTLLATDAVWIARRHRVMSGPPELVARRTIQLALFLFQNNATDVAIDLLVAAARTPGVDLCVFEGQPLFQMLRRKVLLLFKDLSYQPYFGTEDISETYRTIFRAKFPELHDFYGSDLLA
jgi:FkbM family methyltransferase